MLILGIETSCDETSAALVKDGREVLANVVSSSANLFKEIGGVVPEIASRAQIEYMIPVIEKTITKYPNNPPCLLRRSSFSYEGWTFAIEDRDFGRAGRITVKGKKITEFTNLQIYKEKIDAIAVTQGPGLLGSLLVGLNTAKALAWAWKKPLFAVNHLEGHLYANWLITKEDQTTRRLDDQGGKSQITNKSQALNLKFPILHLLVSGGHTQLVWQTGHGKLKVIGQTVDDAAGEAFDKVGKLLGLTYPAGPKLAKMAETGDAKKYNFPRAMLDRENFDFSFSGLKTAVRMALENTLTPTLSHQGRGREKRTLAPRDSWGKSVFLTLSPRGRGQGEGADIAASFQMAVVDVLVEKSIRAIRKLQPKSFALSGGVSANKLLREKIMEKVGHLQKEKNVFIPAIEFTGDNAAMVAAAAYFNPVKADPLKLEAKSDLMI